MISRQKNDCVVCAICEYFNLDYDLVLAELRLRQPDCVSDRLGTRASAYIPYIQSLIGTGRQVNIKVPRRGQDRITGLVRVKRGKADHMVCVKGGMAFDNSGEIMPFIEYRKKYGYTLKSVIF